MRTFLLPLAVATVTAGAPAARQPGHPEVTSATGVTFKGVFDDNFHLDYFKGIPFAEPPVGELRLKSPVPLSLSDGSIVNATSYGPACHQPVSGMSPVPFDQQSEDCLYLNVVRPAGVKPSEKLPVLAWIYGGSFTSGASSIPGYNASWLVERSVEINKPTIYVSLNYRLGVFGWLPGQESLENDATNLGLRDQRLALQWVQQNIAAFGGDPEKVTLFGESAGAISIALQMMRSGNDTEGLYRGVILESGGATTFPVIPAASGTAQLSYDAVVSLTGCASSSSTFECLRSAPVEALYNASLALSHFGPVMDGLTVPDAPSRLIQEGKWSNVPSIMGSNLDEGTLFVSRWIDTQEELARFFSTSIAPGATNETREEILSLYPDGPEAGSPFNTGNQTFNYGSLGKKAAAIFGDVAFLGPTREMRDAAAKRSQPVWGYHFTQFTGNASLGIGFVYSNPRFGGPLQPFAHQMTDYWLTFAKYLNPNHKGLPAWEAFNTDTYPLQQLQAGNVTTVPDVFRRHATDVSIAGAR